MGLQEIQIIQGLHGYSYYMDTGITRITEITGITKITGIIRITKLKKE